MPTVHFMLLQTARTVLSDARYAPVMYPYTTQRQNNRDRSEYQIYATFSTSSSFEYILLYMTRTANYRLCVEIDRSRRGCRQPQPKRLHSHKLHHKIKLGHCASPKCLLSLTNFISSLNFSVFLIASFMF